MPLAISIRSAAVLFFLATLFLIAGCGPDQPALAPVHGKVYHKGVPLTGGSIVFIPDEARGNEGPLAHTDIQPDGTYLLHTGDAKGAVAGWHRVTVLAVEPAKAGTTQPPRTLVPPRYRDPDLSGLSCQVKPGQDNTFDFNLD